MSGKISEYKLECYQIIKPLGRKGNLWLVRESVTYKCFVMRKIFSGSEKIYQMLLNIHHPAIVGIADVFSCDGNTYVIEEYLEMKTLSDILAEKGPFHKGVNPIAFQLLEALQVLHEHGIVHRDIKPENVMMDASGGVKLIDFDIARLFSEKKDNDTTVKGIRDYAPPEQFGFSQSDFRTDIYSLGVTINELAVGKLPEERLCSGNIGTFVRRCTELDPKRRYQSAEQALTHLTKLQRKTRVWNVFIVSCVLSAALFLVVLRNYPANTPPLMGELFDSTVAADRIVYLKDSQMYPAALLSDDGSWDFRMDFKEGETVDVSAVKSGECLSLSVTQQSNKKTEFQFEDVFNSYYAQLGYSINTDIGNTLPEQELLLCDLDQDGRNELIVTLAWRKRVDTPNPDNRYYLTEYSILWTVYLTNEDKVACTEPLYFEGGEPSLDDSMLLYDYWQHSWYGFKEGKWLSLLY